MEKGFIELLFGSLREYVENFNQLFLIVLLFTIIPTIIIFLISLVIPQSMTDSVMDVSRNLYQSGFDREALTFISLSFILIAISFILRYLIQPPCLIFFALKNTGDLKAGEAIKGGLNYLWKYLGYGILLSLFFGVIGGVFVLVISLFIIYAHPQSVLWVYPFYFVWIAILAFFLIRWQFAFYTIVEEDIGIIGCFGRSAELVNGRWWRVFFYNMLMGISAIVIAFLIMWPMFVFESITLNLVLNTIFVVILIPLIVIYLKNFYLDLKDNPLQY
ncbi:MAG: hypothetical protein ABIE22_04690 [archaeon]